MIWMKYKIGEIAKLTNMTPRTIRYYEELNLLGIRENRSQGQIRFFDDNDIERLKKIQMLKDLGLTLEEIGEVIELYFSDGQILEGKRRVIEILKSHIATADEKIRELNAFKLESEANIAKLEAIIKKGESNKKSN